MAEGGEDPGKADYIAKKNKTQNAYTSDEEDCGTQQRPLVAPVQCTDEHETTRRGQEHEEEHNADEGPRAFMTGGTLPFAAAEGKDDKDLLKKKKAKKKVLKFNMQRLYKTLHERNVVTDEMRKLVSLIKEQSQEIDQLDKDIMDKVEILSRTIERMDD